MPHRPRARAPRLGEEHRQPLERQHQAQRAPRAAGNERPAGQWAPAGSTISPRQSRRDIAARARSASAISSSPSAITNAIDFGVRPCNRPCRSSSVGKAAARNTGHLGDLQRRLERDAVVGTAPGHDDGIHVGQRRHERPGGLGGLLDDRCQRRRRSSPRMPARRAIRRLTKSIANEPVKPLVFGPTGSSPTGRSSTCAPQDASGPFGAAVIARVRRPAASAAFAARIDVALAPLCDSTITSGFDAESPISATKSSGSWTPTGPRRAATKRGRATCSALNDDPEPTSATPSKGDQAATLPRTHARPRRCGRAQPAARG